MAESKGIGGSRAAIAGTGVPDWVQRYIGLEFEAMGRGPKYDCYGLTALVLREQFGRTIPDHAQVEGRDGTDRAALAAVIEAQKTEWRDIASGEEQPGDALLLRIMGHPIHVAVVVAPGWMLHMEDGIDACLERYDRPKWQRRVMGIYRYAG